MKIPIVLFGAGSHALVVIDIIEKMAQYQIVGIIDSRMEIGLPFDNYKIIGRQEQIKELVEEYGIQGGVICIGDNYWRAYVASEITRNIPNFNFINAIHPSVIIGKNIRAGFGISIMAGVVINSGSNLGNHCIINTNSTLDHHTIMKDFASVAPGASMGGNVTICKYSVIGIGANILNNIKIGEHVVIGSGALVTKDIESFCLAYGVPAKVIRKRKAGEKYLK